MSGSSTLKAIATPATPPMLVRSASAIKINQTKNMKYKLVLLIIVLQSNLIFGQIKHELSIDGIGAILNRIDFIPTYELVVNKKIGIELELGFDTSTRYLNFHNLPSPEPYSQRRFNPAIGGKYYFSNKKHGSGFYLGPYFRLDFLTRIDEKFGERWGELRMRNPPNWVEKGLRTYFYGIHGGWKFLIKSRIIIEPEFFWFSQNFVNEEPQSIHHDKLLEAELFLNLGYRF